jgi:hypothetical protein
MDIGVEVPHGQSGELLATAGEFPYPRLMLQLGPHKEPPVSYDGGLNFGWTQVKIFVPPRAD